MALQLAVASTRQSLKHLIGASHKGKQVNLQTILYCVLHTTSYNSSNKHHRPTSHPKSPINVRRPQPNHRLLLLHAQHRHPHHAPELKERKARLDEREYLEIHRSLPLGMLVRHQEEVVHHRDHADDDEPADSEDPRAGNGRVLRGGGHAEAVGVAHLRGLLCLFARVYEEDDGEGEREEEHGGRDECVEEGEGDEGGDGAEGAEHDEDDEESLF
ncbi:hypothetical protein CPC08DRAFT_96454 [Agrocybe pediades]|nr:hypothetical protein CPC08DRAFT_96454 [Agrocybe pediades]